MKTASEIRSLVILLSIFFLFHACGSADEQANIFHGEGKACAILAHPDDETIISGTLAMLAEQGIETTVVYVTSGDDGPDETGRNLNGIRLAEVREAEATEALRSIGIKNPPVFLRFPDGHVPQYVDSVKQLLVALIEEIKPRVVIGFGPEGITGHWDHMAAGAASDSAFDQSGSGEWLLHMAITEPLPPYYANGIPVSKNEVDVVVKVSRYFKQKKLAVEAHKTQFSKRTRSAYKLYVHTMRKERFIIARSTDDQKQD